VPLWLNYHLTKFIPKKIFGDRIMAVYKCEVCDTVYDEEKEDVKWDDLPDNWICPVCGSGKSYYKLVQDIATIPDTSDTPGYRDESYRTPKLEGYMAYP